ncbi:MAG TPA: hypothetical protein VK195_20340 [Burkholderiaceae bacterium]|nr:hypothetical protein [Burkholderiaceae bacterium]
MSQPAACTSPASELQLGTVPTFLRYLRQLDGFLDLAQSHCLLPPHGRLPDARQQGLPLGKAQFDGLHRY